MTDPNVGAESGGSRCALLLLAECLLMLCWYLDDAGGEHFERSTRREYLEGAAEDLSKGGGFVYGFLAEARLNLATRYSAHPLSEEFTNFLDKFLEHIRYLVDESGKEKHE